MWIQDTYEGYQGKFWSLPPRKVLPKPCKKPHPAMWYAAGNTTSYEMAAHKGLGVLGFSVGPSRTSSRREAVQEGHRNAEPVGAFVNDNLMVATRRSWPRKPETDLPASLHRVHAQYTWLSNVFRHPTTRSRIPPEVPEVAGPDPRADPG